MNKKTPNAKFKTWVKIAFHVNNFELFIHNFTKISKNKL